MADDSKHWLFKEVLRHHCRRARGVCRFCNRVESTGYSHMIRCRGYWNLNQEQLQNNPRVKTYSCRYCGCNVYSVREEARHRSCWHCLKASKAESVRKSRQKRRKAKEPIQCLKCGVSFAPKRSTAKFCGTACRVAAKRIRDGNAKTKWPPLDTFQDRVTPEGRSDG